MADNSENTEELPDNVQELENPPERRGRGRPKGSRDSVPRRPRMVIVETPVPDAEPEPATDAPAPPSPKTLFKQASDQLASLHADRERARRAYWMDAITKTIR